MSPLVMSWKAWFEPLFAARLYSMGLTFPNPFEDVASFNNAKTPAKVGAPAEVPPTAEKLLLASRNPFVQSPGPQIK